MLRYLFSGCGPAQWRLNGFDADENAAKAVEAVPVPPMMALTAKIVFILPILLIVFLFLNPYVLTILPVIALPYYYFNRN
jgi:hypothetical protein